MPRALLILVLSAAFSSFASFSAATPASASQAGAAAVRVGGSVPSPQKIVDVKPTVPPEWLRQGNGMEGVVAIDVTIGEDGRVRDAVVTHSIPALDRAALEAVRQWQYAPTVVNGKALAVILPVQVSFPSRVLPPSPPAASTIRLTSSRRQDGEWTVWDIPVTRAATLPHWNLDTDVPLPVTDAARIGRAWLQQQNPQMRIETQSVTLTRMRRGADVDFWFYQIDCFGYAVGPQPSGPLMKVVVLPDRSVVEPARNDFDAPPVGPYRAGPGVTMPRLLHEVRPEYTRDALERKILRSRARARRGGHRRCAARSAGRSFARRRLRARPAGAESGRPGSIRARHERRPARSCGRHD